MRRLDHHLAGPHGEQPHRRHHHPRRHQARRRPRHGRRLLREPRRGLRPEEQGTVRLRRRRRRRAPLRRDAGRQPEPDHPCARAGRHPERVRQHQVRRGARLRAAAGGGAVHGYHRRAGGGVAAGDGGAGRQRRAVRRLRVHGEAIEDVVPLGGSAAHERRRRALRSIVPVWLRPPDTAVHILEGNCMA